MKMATKNEGEQTVAQIVRGIVSSFNPKAKGAKGNWPQQRQLKAVREAVGRNIRANETGFVIEFDDSMKANVQSVTNLVDGFAEQSNWWEATAKYGRQHYNESGFLHTDGLHRMTNQGLATLVAQAGEVLAQRSVHSGSEVVNDAMDPTDAEKMVPVLVEFLSKRAGVLKRDKKRQALALLEADGAVYLEQKE